MSSDIVFSIPHEYRKALGRPLSHDCLARVLTAKLAAKDGDKSTETLNTAVRGQIILGSDESADIAAINGMLQLSAYNLGHSTTAFTMDKYGHVTETMMKDSADKMQRFIESL